MKRKLCLFLTLLMLLGCIAAGAESAETLPAQWINSMVAGSVQEDTPTDPKEDFFLYVNKDWLLNTQLTETEYCITWFSDQEKSVRESVSELLSADFSEDHDIRQSQIFYQQYLDMDTRNALGADPLLPYFEEIEAISSMEELDAYLPKEDAFGALLQWGIAGDLVDSSRNVVWIEPVSLSLEDADEYQTLTDYGARKKEGITRLLQSELELCGYTEEEAAGHVENLYALEYALADSIYGSSVSKQSDYMQKIYNPFTLEELETMAPNLPLAELLAEPIAAGAEIFLVPMPDWLTCLNEFYTQDNLEVIKSFFLCQTASGAASMLDQAFMDCIDAYNSLLVGTEYHTDLEQTAYTTTNSFLPWSVGKMYAAAYGSEEINRRVEDLVDQVLAVYRTRLENNTWLGEETREMAVEKLDCLRVRVGYPQDWSPYELASLDLKTTEEGGTLLENYLLICNFQKEQSLETLNEAVDKEEWIATPQTVNAYYNPSDNSINLPSAILASVLEDGEVSDEVLLGTIGTIIGHEITHGFDTTGSQFDADGNLRNWWTDEDRAAFEELTAKVEAYYSAIEALPGKYVDGQLTIGETVADLGGLSCALEIARDIEEFDYAAFFQSFAEIWRLKTTPEMTEILLTDEHPPHYLRANVNVQQFEEFYQTYDVQPGDGMYLAPEARLSVW